MGIPELEAKQYEGKIKDGNILVSIHVENSDDEFRARKTLERHEATDIVTAGSRKCPIRPPSEALSGSQGSSAPRVDAGASIRVSALCRIERPPGKRTTMDTTLSDTMPSGRAPVFPGRVVEEGIPSVQSQVRPAVTVEPPAPAPKARYGLMDGIKMVTGIISVIKAVTPVVKMLRVATPPSVLSVFGLSRRRSKLASLAIFGVGLAVGIGAGLVLTPAKGFDLRRRLVVGTKKKNKSKDPERKMASWISERTASIQDAVDTRVDPLADTLRDANKATARAGTPPPDREHAAVAGTEAAAPTRTPGAGVGGGYRFG